MNNDPSFFLIFVVELVFVIVWMAFAAHHALGFTSKGVVKRLRKWQDQPVIMRLPWLGGSWNPSKPEMIQYQLVGPGKAVYRLVGDDEIEVDYSPRWGTRQRLSGPIPPSVDNAAHRHLHPLALKILAGYVVVLLVGALVGGLVAHGSASEHGTGAVVGFVIATLVASFSATAFVGIRSFTHHSQGGTSEPAVKPNEESGQQEDIWKRIDRNERIARRYLEEHDHGSSPT
jgi:hypothetical protein